MKGPIPGTGRSSPGVRAARMPKLLTAEEIAELDGAGREASEIINVSGLPDDVAAQLAAALKMIDGPSILEFDSAMYSDEYKGEHGDDEADYLAFRCIRNSKGLAGFSIHPVGPVKHLETAVELKKLAS